MSFRELRNLTEMMRALGYPRPISVENFRQPNFELVSDLLYWMVKKYDPRSNLSEEIDTENDRVHFLSQVVSEVIAKARIRLNPKKLYAADGYAVKELIKLARVLYDASRVDASETEKMDEDEDDVSLKSLLGSRVRDPKALRQLASDITQSGAKIYELLEVEPEVRELRLQALRFLDTLSTNGENSAEQRYLERSVREQLRVAQENVETTEQQCVELEAEERALAAKIKKAQTDLERSEKRLKSLQHVRPAFMDEYERLEKDLERQYAIYCERFRNLDYLQRELDLHNTREMKRLAENDKSLKRLQKKFRDDELAILRGEQEDQFESAPVMENGESKGRGDNNRKSMKSTSEATAKDNKKEAMSESGDSGSDGRDDESSDESGASGSGSESGSQAAPNASDSDEVSLADSADLGDNDDASGSEDNDSGDGSDSGSGSQDSGSGTNSDSDHNF